MVDGCGMDLGSLGGDTSHQKMTFSVGCRGNTVLVIIQLPMPGEAMACASSKRRQKLCHILLFVFAILVPTTTFLGGGFPEADMISSEIGTHMRNCVEQLLLPVCASPGTEREAAAYGAGMSG